MSARFATPVTYIAVLVVLVLLTCLTVGLSFVPLTGKWHAVLGLLVAVCKASLVGLFFMHLIDSRPTVWAVVIVSLFWVTVVLFGLTFSDYLTRLWIPFVPGH
jgi:cytochrome c oxidase subunit IV